MTIALIDYGAGNLTSVIKAFQAVGADLQVVSEPDGVAGARAIVVPGVGHFGTTRALDADWRGTVNEAMHRGTPLLGICLGLQWLFEGSAEAPENPGLGVMPGRCFRIEGNVKVPHVGWNSLDLTPRASRLLEGIPSGSSAYFTHSYAAPVVEDTVASTTHAVSFSAVVERERVFGAQFHPEKSGHTGLQMLTNFLRVVEEAH